jgi:hypothetical protein
MTSNIVTGILSVVQYFFGAASVFSAFSKAVMIALIFLSLYNLTAIIVKIIVKRTASKSYKCNNVTS